MNYRFEPAARLELLEAANWYFDEGGELLARDFEVTALRAVRLVASMPMLGTHVYPGTRRWPLRRFPYTLIYLIENDNISYFPQVELRIWREFPGQTGGR